MQKKYNKHFERSDIHIFYEEWYTYCSTLHLSLLFLGMFDDVVCIHAPVSTHVKTSATRNQRNYSLALRRDRLFAINRNKITRCASDKSVQRIRPHRAQLHSRTTRKSGSSFTTVKKIWQNGLSSSLHFLGKEVGSAYRGSSPFSAPWNPWRNPYSSEDWNLPWFLQGSTNITQIPSSPLKPQPTGHECRKITTPTGAAATARPSIFGKR